ncbi:MAG TPA: asparagine synthase-related protein [Solirubrobacteraceae bacterium]|nr:asparagine synthase-related protein [Solirubrobacteraceae bacterium]
MPLTRSFAGVLDANPRADRSRLLGALAPQPSHARELGPLQVAYSGAPVPAATPLCLLAGHIDNAATLCAELEAVPAPVVPERDLLGQGAARGPAPEQPNESGGRCPDRGPARREATIESLLCSAYLRWGLELPSRLRGDFALLIWDSRRERGLIARDQLGVRCLYIHERNGALWFATEVHELLGLLPSRPPPDRAGLAHWIAASNRPGEDTLYEGVRRLAPGSMLVLERTHARARVCVRARRYWAPSYEEPLDDRERDLDLSLREALGHAVARRLACTGQTGVLMSGGLDSASVAALAAAQRPDGVLSCSGTFPEHPAVDESALIGQLRSTLRLAGVTAQVRAGGLLASALESQRRSQLPLLSWGDFWTLPLLRAAGAEGVQTILGGDGGDELFAVRAYLLADSLRAGRPRRALELARQLPGAGQRPSRIALARVTATLALGGALPYRTNELLRSSFARLPSSHLPFARAGLPGWLLPDGTRAVRESADPHAWKRLSGPRWWAHAAHELARGVEETGLFDLHRHRAALAGLEARHPLLDLDLVELVLRQPPVSTFDRDRNRPVLRAAMAGMLPDSVRLRARKALFDSLIVDTLSGPDLAAVRRLLCDPRAELGSYVELGAMNRALLARPPAGARGPSAGSPARERERFTWMQDVWRLATAECWLRAQADPANERLDQLVAASPARVRLTHDAGTFFHLDCTVRSRRISTLSGTSPSLAGRSLGRKADISSRTKESNHGE